MDNGIYSYDSPYVVDNVGKYRKELEHLLSISRVKRYCPGEIVYMQGERSRRFYFIKSGKIKISILKEDGSEKILAIQERNTFFGESAAFDRYRYFATATVLEKSEFHHIDIEDVEALIMKNPEVSFLVITAIIRKMRLLGLQVEDLSFLDAQQRIARILSKIARDVGRRTKEGWVTIRKNITHEDLASLTGLSRVTVTNILNHLERLGMLTKKRRVLTITDIERLDDLLDDSQPGGKTA